MTTVIQKWGNSLAVRLSKAVAEAATLRSGTAVEVEARAGRVVVTPVKHRKLRLNDLVRRITKSNRHDETDFGSERGHEAW